MARAPRRRIPSSQRKSEEVQLGALVTLGGNVLFDTSGTESKRAFSGKTIIHGDIASYGALSNRMLKVKEYFENKHTSYGYFTKGSGGGYVTDAVARAFIAVVQRAIDNPSYVPGLQWDPQDDVYARWKRSHFSGAGPWLRTGQLQQSIKVIKNTTWGQTIGFDPKVMAWKIGYSGIKTKSVYSIGEIARRLEFGYTATDTYKGMPARPLFAPTLRYFYSVHFPKIAHGIKNAIIATEQKHFHAHLTKASAVKEITGTSNFTRESAARSGSLEDDVVEIVERDVLYDYTKVIRRSIGD